MDAFTLCWILKRGLQNYATRSISTLDQWAAHTLQVLVQVKVTEATRRIQPLRLATLAWLRCTAV